MGDWTFNIGGGGRLQVGPVKFAIGFSGAPLSDGHGGFTAGVSAGKISGVASYNPITEDWSATGLYTPFSPLPSGIGASPFLGIGINQDGGYFVGGGKATFNGGQPYLITSAAAVYKSDLFTWGDILHTINDMGLDIHYYFHDFFHDVEMGAGIVACALADMVGAFTDACSVSPIVLDLNNNGIEYIKNDSVSSIFYDIDADKFAEKTEWIKPTDGFLVRDLNNNGRIDSQAEMFGDNGGTSAYAKLGFARYQS